MREEISALMDGELSDAEAKRLLDQMKRNPELRGQWSSFHLVGDVLRREAEMSRGFTSRVMTRLDAEPVVVAPFARVLQASRPLRTALPLAASVAGIAVVGWLALGMNKDQSVAPIAAAPVVQSVTVTHPQTQPPTIAAAPQQSQTKQPVMTVSVPMPSSAIKEYLIAHQGYSPSSNMQGMAPYIRTVTEERQAPNR